MKVAYIILIILVILIVAVGGYFLINNRNIKYFPITKQGGQDLTNIEQAQIQKILTENFLSFNVSFIGEIKAHCNSENTKINIPLLVLEEGTSENILSAFVECNCGIECMYSANYILEKINNEWKIKGVGQMALA